jgi:hypothetical protein
MTVDRKTWLNREQEDVLYVREVLQTGWINTTTGRFSRTDNGGQKINKCYDNTGKIVYVNDELTGFLWTPENIETTAWYDASDTSTIYHVADAVGDWDDKSGNGYDLSQTSQANKPQTNGSTIGGLNALSFDGSIQYIFNDSLASNFTGEDKPISVFAVMKPTTGSSTVNRVMWGFGYSGSDIPIIIQGVNGTPGTANGSWYRARDNSNNLIFDKNSNALTMENDYLTSFVSDGINSNTWLNGTTEYSDSNDQGNITLDKFTIGALRRTSTGLHYRGLVGELVFFNSELNTTDRQKMEGYLAHKWSLTDNLDSGHPYKTVPPS